MGKVNLPLTVSARSTELEPGAEPIRINPFANMGITSEAAPVLLALEAAKTVGVEEFATKMVRSGGQGTLAQARLALNATLTVLESLVDEYGAVTVQTPMGTVETFIAGTLENAQDQPDPGKNYAFLGIVVPECYRRLFAQIETYVPSEACPASLKRVRDKATNAKGLRGTDPFYLEGWNMSIGGEGETLELLDPVTRDKLCDVSVEAETKSPVQFVCTLAASTEIPTGSYLLRLTTLAGGDTVLWPVELKVELLEGVTPLKCITIERCDCYTDSEFAAIGDNFDGATGYRVEDGKRYVKGKFQVLEDPEVEIELWQDEDTDEPRLWHSNDTGEAPSGAAFTFKLTADPAKPDFKQETVTYEGTVG